MKALKLLVIIPLTLALLPFQIVGTVAGLAWAFFMAGFNETATAIAELVCSVTERKGGAA